MKTIKIILVVLLATFVISCEKDDSVDCECTKFMYKWDHRVVNHNGIFRIENFKVELGNEKVVCQDEIQGASMGNDVLYNIVCY